jgi:hypothetical protein
MEAGEESPVSLNLNSALAAKKASKKLKPTSTRNSITKKASLTFSDIKHDYEMSPHEESEPGQYEINLGDGDEDDEDVQQ